MDDSSFLAFMIYLQVIGLALMVLFFLKTLYPPRGK